jgi:hypothetical protein
MRLLEILSRTFAHGLSPTEPFANRARRQPMAAASWRSGYAEDCKSLHPGSIPGEASNLSHFRGFSQTFLMVCRKQKAIENKRPSV